MLPPTRIAHVWYAPAATRTAGVCAAAGKPIASKKGSATHPLFLPRSSFIVSPLLKTEASLASSAAQTEPAPTQDWSEVIHTNHHLCQPLSSGDGTLVTVKAEKLARKRARLFRLMRLSCA